MLDSEFDKWHSKQAKREDALKEVEDKVYDDQNWTLMQSATILGL
jgi:hypothetical protein